MSNTIGAAASAVCLVACCALMLLSTAGVIFNGPPDRSPGTDVAIRQPSELAVWRPQPVGGLLPWTPPENPVPILSPPRICAGRPVAPNFWEWSQ